jgi:hypothetical protein
MSSWDDDGDGDEGGARRGGRILTRVRITPVAMGPCADLTAICVFAPWTCWRWSKGSYRGVFGFLNGEYIMCA